MLGLVATPFAVTAVWERAVMLDTGRYVRAVTPPIDRPAVRRAVADTLADRLLAGERRRA